MAAGAVAVVLVLLAVALVVQRMARTAECRRLAAQDPLARAYGDPVGAAVAAPPNDDLPPVGAVDLEVLLYEIYAAQTRHRFPGIYGEDGQA